MGAMSLGRMVRSAGRNTGITTITITWTSSLMIQVRLESGGKCARYFFIINDR